MKKWLIVGIIVIITITLLGISSYNELISKQNNLETKLSQIDLELKNKSDTTNKLINNVKDTLKHEKDIINDVIKTKEDLDNATITKKIKLNSKLTETINNLYVSIENYPSLKSDPNFIELQNEITNIENNIAYLRSEYNKEAKEYNSSIKKIPSNFIAKIMNFKEANYFEN